MDAFELDEDLFGLGGFSRNVSLAAISKVFGPMEKTRFKQRTIGLRVIGRRNQSDKIVSDSRSIRATHASRLARHLGAKPLLPYVTVINAAQYGSS